MSFDIHTTPRVYIGTYRKYNSGSLSGKWFELADYSSKEELLKAAQEYHGVSEEHEFMFQDWEGVPQRFVSESHIDESLWEEYIDLDDDERKVLVGWLEYELKGTLERAQETFVGVYDSPRDYAYEYIEQQMDRSQFKIVENYLDLDAIVRDLDCGDMFFTTVDGKTYAYNTAA